jgi:hypothetical protein
MRKRVDLNLNSHLASLSACVGGGLEPDHTLQWLEAQLPNFVSLGALTQAEASKWRKRFSLAEEAVRSPDDEVVPDRLRARATTLLEETTESVRQTKGERGREALSRFHASLYAFKALGTVSDQDVSEWHERVRSAILEGRREPKNPKERPYIAGELRRVVVGPRQRLAGVRVTCAEFYADCVIVRWQRLISAEELAEDLDSGTRGPSADEVVRRWGAVFELHDNLGTRYVAADPGSEITGSREASEKREPSPVWGRSVFVPAAPEEAKSLMALRGADEFKLNLRLLVR